MREEVEKGFFVSFDYRLAEIRATGFTGQSFAKSAAGRISNLPAVAVVVLDELIGFGAVGRAQFLGIPHQFFAGAKGDVAQ